MKACAIIGTCLTAQTFVGLSFVSKKLTTSYQKLRYRVIASKNLNFFSDFFIIISNVAKAAIETLNLTLSRLTSKFRKTFYANSVTSQQARPKNQTVSSDPLPSETSLNRSNPFVLVEALVPSPLKETSLSFQDHQRLLSPSSPNFFKKTSTPSAPSDIPCNPSPHAQINEAACETGHPLVPISTAHTFHNWKIIESPGDGNCLFHTLHTHLLQTHPSHFEKAGFSHVPSYTELRKACVEYIRENWSRDPVLKKHLKNAIEAHDEAIINGFKNELLFYQLQLFDESSSPSEIEKLYNETDLKILNREGCLCSIFIENVTDIIPETDFHEIETENPQEKRAIEAAIDKYLQKISQEGVMCSASEIYAASCLFNLDIYMVRKLGNRITSAMDPPFLNPNLIEPKPSIHIFYNASHYDALISPNQENPAETLIGG